MARGKKEIINIKLIIGIITFLFLLVGASYAYFAVEVDSSDYNKTIITGSTEGVAIASIQNPTTKLNLNVDSAMMSQKNLGTIYADDESDYVKTKSEGFHDVGVITLTNSKKDDNIYRCTANVTITVGNSNNSILNTLQEGDLKAFLRWGIHYEAIDLSTLQETGKTTIPISLDIVGNNSKSIETYIELTNKEEDQSYLAGKDINIDIDTTDLKCELTGERAVFYERNDSPLRKDTEENIDKIKNIYFVNYVDTSNAAFEAKDYTKVGTGKNQSPAGSIIGWFEEIPKNADDEEQYYDLYIGSKDRIYGVAHQYSAFHFLLSTLSSLETVHYDNFYSDLMVHAQNLSGEASYENFETENLIWAPNMFAGSKNTKLDLRNLNTKNVTTMASMFRGLSNVTELDVSNFNTSKVTDMNNMFNEMNSLTKLDVSGFDTSKVTNMSSMFRMMENLEFLDVSHFNTSKVTNMFLMFAGCHKLQFIDVSNFDTREVTNMAYMFSTLYDLKELDVSNFDTRKVTTMQDMFNEMRTIERLDLSNFNTNLVTNTRSMFYGMSSLKYLDLRNAEFRQVTDYSYMFSGVSSGITIIVKDEENRDWIEERLKEARIKGNVLLPSEIES